VLKTFELMTATTTF